MSDRLARLHAWITKPTDLPWPVVVILVAAYCWALIFAIDTHNCPMAAFTAAAFALWFPSNYKRLRKAWRERGKR